METHSCINDLGINCYGRTEMMKNIKRMLAFMGIVSKPLQKPVDRLTLFQGMSQVLSRRKTTR